MDSGSCCSWSSWSIWAKAQTYGRTAAAALIAHLGCAGPRSSPSPAPVAAVRPHASPSARESRPAICSRPCSKRHPWSPCGATVLHTLHRFSVLHADTSFCLLRATFPPGEPQIFQRSKGLAQVYEDAVTLAGNSGGSSARRRRLLFLRSYGVKPGKRACRLAAKCLPYLRMVSAWVLPDVGWKECGEL
jgi:hypothetical protein